MSYTAHKFTNVLRQNNRKIRELSIMLSFNMQMVHAEGFQEVHSHKVLECQCTCNLHTEKPTESCYCSMQDMATVITHADSST